MHIVSHIVTHKSPPPPPLCLYTDRGTGLVSIIQIIFLWVQEWEGWTCLPPAAVASASYCNTVPIDELLHGTEGGGAGVVGITVSLMQMCITVHTSYVVFLAVYVHATYVHICVLKFVIVCLFVSPKPPLWLWNNFSTLWRCKPRARELLPVTTAAHLTLRLTRVGALGEVKINPW
jgi:hypothetical protein